MTSNQDQVTIDMLPNEILMEYLFPLLSSSDLWHLSQLSNLLRHKVRMYFDEFNTVLNLGVSDEDYQTNRWQNLFLNDIKSMFRRQEHKSGDSDSSAEYEKLEFVTENSTSLLKIHLQWDSVLDFHDKILQQALLRNKVWLSLKHAISLNVHFDYCEAQARVRQGSARDGSQGERLQSLNPCLELTLKLVATHPPPTTTHHNKFEFYLTNG